ncbi:ZYBA0S07-04808g1_1 [Zygosaccharomyces bailii CLIB 213]|uniref:ZYBA0S07-04808g1_1 n=1 Tax=Zygosaccharomyces bailii (strain CLIB 213 / ATCC 58445 / CBS 680 / BCRC 21525 / NBRC 1098 / NCYC 1416 / NRRL Y-2227) TaxID=1333698 RepID=A0A8J2X9F4_ZYGB2|nr:ZYBA0S07-04808g1_1 [Zygosaccharomyces bailii CLIB 213]
MKIYLAFFTVLLYLKAVQCVLLSSIGTSVPESAKIWSIASYLLRNCNENILQSIYPMILQLDDETEDSLGDSLCYTVAKLISDLGEPHLASLMPLYCKWYPMGNQDPHERYTYVPNELYFILNGKKYENPDDVYYLKSGELKKQAQLPDSKMLAPGEVVIGNNREAPIVHFYGCPDEKGVFQEFNRNLFSEATQTGKLRFIWRSTCSLEKTALGPFPVALTTKEQSNLENLPQEILKIPESFDKSKYDLLTPREDEFTNVDLKAAKLIADHYQNNQNFDAAFLYAKDFVNNFPILVSELLSLSGDTDVISKSNDELANKGVDHNLLGLYINGQNWKVSSLNEVTLLDALEAELHKLRQLSFSLSKIDNRVSLLTAKNLINDFARISLPNLQQSQPVKLDLHRIRGFSESVIYFNDIEIDDQYHDLSQDIEKFFEKSKFGEIPEYRHNWSELIFVIDFNNLEDPDTKLALEGLQRAISVITQGYPQRIGLLPLNTGEAESIIKKIYHLRDKDLLLLEDFLKDLPIGRGRISADYQNTPDTAKLLRNLQIDQTSIIINGEIYPFRKNTWHYLVAKTIKKDTGFLKRELSKYIKHDEGKVRPMIDVRGILHLKSSETRHKKYTPDYFADSTYTAMDNTVLDVWNDRLCEYFKGKEYNVLHTITIVDDFNTVQALKRLYNLVHVKFVGIRFRAIHTGILSSTWNKVKDSSSKSSFNSILKSIIKKCSHYEPKYQLDDIVLQSWLPDLTPLFFSAKSFMIINGRFLHFEIDEIPQTKLFEATIKREAQRTLDTLEALEISYPGFSEKKIDSELVESISAILTKMFYQGTDIYHNGPDYSTETSLSRIDLTKILEINNFTIFQNVNHELRPIDLVLIVDPLEERTQKFYSLLEEVKGLSFVNLKIVLYPTKDLKIMPINRIYVQDFKNELGSKLPELSKIFDVEIEAPSNLAITSNQRVIGYVIEVHAFDKDDAVSEGVVDGIGGVCLELVDAKENVVDQTITMKTFGYAQFIAPQLWCQYYVRSCDPQYKVISFSSDARSDYLPVKSFDLKNFNPIKVYVQLEKTAAPVISAERENIINIFTVLKNDIAAEGNYKKMVLSILLSPQRHQQDVKFWILDQPYLSASLKKFIEDVNSDPQLDAKIELIQYKWPSWLRPQRFIARRIDALKILLLDVLFPQTVQKVFYMDPEISQLPDPFKLNEKITTKLPFAMFKMVGHGYWETGYWAKRIGEHNLKFHSVEPMFAINLKKFRDLDGGDKLRIHYQRLSADANSLAKVDQDLINDVQEEVPIRTLSRSTIKYLKTDPHVIEAWLEKKEAGTSLSGDDTELLSESNEVLHDEL